MYAKNVIYDFNISKGQNVEFDLITPGKPAQHIAQARLENEDGAALQVSYHVLGGLFRKHLVERRITILKRLGGKSKDTYQIPQWIGQLDLS